MTTADLTTRRAILAALPVAGAAAVLAAGSSQMLAAAPRPARISPELDALIKAHCAAYRTFTGRFIDREVDKRTFSALNRAEERALLAVCAYPAITRLDRRVKVRYLLAIEKRGELDLPKHMKAVLRAML